MNKPNAVIYLRVSTSAQCSDDAISLSVQEQKCRDYCQVNEINLVEVCADEGISASKGKFRPGLIRALSLLNEETMLVVYSMTRITRDTAQSSNIIEEILAKKSDLVSICETLNVSNAMEQCQIILSSVMEHH